jgi:spore germination protein KC
VELDELINNITTVGIEPVLTGVKIVGESRIGDDNLNVETVDPKTRIKIDSIAAFKVDRLKGWLSIKESIGYNYIVDNINFTIVVLKEQNCNVTVETVKSKTKISSMSSRGKPIITVNVKSEGNIGEIQCKLDLTKNDTMKKLEKNYEERQKKVIMSVIKKAQTEFKSDIFGFGEEVYRTNPTLWKKIKGNWDEEFSNLEVKVNVNSKIRDAGTITKSF